jgi:hypothetical protein
MGHREIQLAAVLSSHRASRHVAAPSLGHYASLSFVVIGRAQRAGWLIRKLENEKISQTDDLPLTAYHL